ncbi:MAG: hypothetical protein CMO55_06790 [Verrucomicrobiales bacterium]|nr:hypothetical protein [Verrucomicrobiales bacterium]
MWTPLPEISETDHEHISSLWNDPHANKLSETVHLVSQRNYAPQLAVVIALDYLSLTTALDYEDSHHVWHHPSISIRLAEGGSISIVYNPGGKGNVEATTRKIVPSPTEAASIIDIIMLRMPHDTTEVERQIAAFESRKKKQN